MKLLAEFDQELREIEIKIDGLNVIARVGERSYKLEAREVEPNTYLFNLDGRVYECYVAPRDAAGVTRVRQGAKSFDFKLSDPKRLRAAQNFGAGSAAEGTAQITTMMPGKIVRIIAETGQTVKAGDPVIVVEAMKMQNEMKSPKSGTIKEIRFQIGATVNAGDVLAVIE
jgi:biotin carboxyl carrier protein